MKHFLSLLFTYVWFFTAPLVAYGTDDDFIVQLDEMGLPAAHKSYIRQFLFERESQCLGHGIDFQLEIDPEAIYRILISDDGSKATIFHVVLNCDSAGNLWNSTSGIQTFILVADKIFESWLMAPPKRLIVDDKLALMLSLDSSQCEFLSDQVFLDAVETCYSILRWIPEAESFQGVRIQ